MKEFAAADPGLQARTKLAIEATRAAVARYEGTRLDLADVPGLDDRCRDDVLEKWNQHVQDSASEAETLLVRAILGWSGTTGPFDIHEAEKVAHPPRGVLCDGRLYIAAQSPDADVPLGQRHQDGRHHVMRLTVLDAASVVRLDAEGGGPC